MLPFLMYKTSYTFYIKVCFFKNRYNKNAYILISMEFLPITYVYDNILVSVSFI